MPIPPRPVSPEQFADGRRLYEQTRRAVADIAAMMGIAERTFFARLRKWGWRRRTSRIPLSDPERKPMEYAAPIPPASAGEPPSETAAVAARIERLVERELTAIEKTVARYGLDDEGTGEIERRARVLASLSRTLQEMKRLDASDTRRKEDNDRGPADNDEFIRGLLRRIEEVAARHQVGGSEQSAASAT